MKQGRLSTKDKWQKHLQLKGIDDADKKRRVFSFIAMIVIAIVVLSSLIATNYTIYSKSFTLILSIALSSMIITLFLYIKTKNFAKSSLVLSIAILFLTIVLAYTGGKENTALYWLMFSPLAAYAIFGIYFGSLLITCLILSILVILYGPDLGQTIYGVTETSRFLSSYCIVILFAFINEYFRNQSFETISTITLEQRNQANSDPLTGLANRRFIDSQLLPQVQNDQASFLPLSIIMVDIDSFKLINDNFGHDVGDKAIIHVGHLLKNKVRITDVVTRYGGEEFLIFLPKANITQAKEIAEKAREKLVETPLTIKGEPAILTASFGVAEIEDLSCYEQAVKQADTNLYRAKKSGKNKVIG